jgi:competence protein ComEA
MNYIALRFIILAMLCVATPAFSGSQVDINSADAKTLAQSLDGVGLVKAEAIVAYRNAHGPFETLEDLAKVEGLGPRVIEENREMIVIGKPHPAASPHGSPHSLANW